MQAPGENKKEKPKLISLHPAAAFWCNIQSTSSVQNNTVNAQNNQSQNTPGGSATNRPQNLRRARQRAKRKKFPPPSTKYPLHDLPNQHTPFPIMDFTRDVDELVDDTHNMQGFNCQTMYSNEETPVKKPFTMQIKKNTEKSEIMKQPTQVQGNKKTRKDKRNNTSGAVKSNNGTADTNPKLANQELRDCLASDIKTIVRDNVNRKKTKIQPLITPRDVNALRYPSAQFPRYPKGIPKSYLRRNNQIVVGAQQSDNTPSQQISNPYTQPYQTNMDVGSAQPTFGQQTPTSTQVGSYTAAVTQQYSPTAVCNDLEKQEQAVNEGSESPKRNHAEKRVSAFQRLGPQTQPKKPKLTINLSFDKEEAVREVVNEADAPKVYMPVPEREDILSSTDDIVMRYLTLWPWTKNLSFRRTARNRRSKSAMMMERDQMDETYRRDNAFIQVAVTGYPSTWTKENVLDALLDRLEGKSFIPCFIEFNEQECKFLVIRCRAALLVIHDLEFYIIKDDVQLSIIISLVSLTGMQLDFIPRIVLGKRLYLKAYKKAVNKLNLSAFTLQPDVSHFIYFPMHRTTNQGELMALKTDINWYYLSELDLSHNRLTSIHGFDLENSTPRLKSLDLSFNCIKSITILLSCRNLPLHSLRMEGNPLCHDYTDPALYVQVARMMFSELRELDGMRIRVEGEMPATNRNYCPEDAAGTIDKFLRTYFPLLEARADARPHVLELYADDAVLTVTYSNKLASGPEYRFTCGLLFKSRVLLEGHMEKVDGVTNIQKLLKRLPNFEHDPLTFTVDVLYHSETSTIFRVDGILKILADSLADNDQLIAFSRTFHLHTTDCMEYKIKNEMVYWAQPTDEYAKSAFKFTAVKRKSVGLKFESPPDEISKKILVEIFMKLTNLEHNPSERCLHLKDWDLREALDYFVELYKSNDIQTLNAT